MQENMRTPTKCHIVVTWKAFLPVKMKIVMQKVITAADYKSIYVKITT